MQFFTFPIQNFLALQVEEKAKSEANPRFVLKAQVTFLPQQLFQFRSPYEGGLSLHSVNQLPMTQSYTIYAGYELANGLDFYLNPEDTRGKGVGDGFGLAQYTNGEAIHGGGAGPNPTFARAFLRWTISRGGSTSKVEAGINQVAQNVPDHRITVTAGRYSVNDLFDTNSYANDGRNQFMNWAFITNPAFDFSADSRGYVNGLSLEWANPSNALRYEISQESTQANGGTLDGQLLKNFCQYLEFDQQMSLLKHKDSGKVRFLGYMNRGNYGDYRQVLSLTQPGAVPDFSTNRQDGRLKYGFAVNLEQPLGDGGDTGAFARIGWNDGNTESFNYTEADETFSLGMQISGKRWKQGKQMAGIAVGLAGISAPHREYLSAGGLGFQIGDGALKYGQEQTFETYWKSQISKSTSVTLDYQLINNPAYNQSRGPVSALGIRLHFDF